VKIRKITLILGFIFFSISVIGQSENQISKFENVLGKTNSETLTYLLSDFENHFLKQNFPKLSVEKSYERLLENISQGKYNHLTVLSENKNFSKEAKNRFNNSQLKQELYYFRDSVWFEGEKLKAGFYYKNPNGTTEFKTVNILKKDFMNEMEKDSLVQLLMDSPREFKTFGKYMNAMKSVKNNDSFLENYYDDKETAGFLSPEIYAKLMLNYKLDFSNYFYKRIILLEFVY
jgi:hypothetical protein